jgi:hypothetical protein
MERDPDAADPADPTDAPPPVPDGLPDPATIAEAEELNDPLAGPHVHDVTDPTDPIGNRRDATGRG